MNHNLQTITIKAAGNVFPIEIVGEEEESYRIAEQILNKKVEYYEKKYSHSTRNSVIAMASYDLVVGFLRHLAANDNSNLLNELETLL